MKAHEVVAGAIVALAICTVLSWLRIEQGVPRYVTFSCAAAVGGSLALWLTRRDR